MAVDSLGSWLTLALGFGLVAVVMPRSWNLVAGLVGLVSLGGLVALATSWPATAGVAIRASVWMLTAGVVVIVITPAEVVSEPGPPTQTAGFQMLGLLAAGVLIRTVAMIVGVATGWPKPAQVEVAVAPMDRWHLYQNLVWMLAAYLVSLVAETWILSQPARWHELPGPLKRWVSRQLFRRKLAERLGWR